MAVAREPAEGHHLERSVQVLPVQLGPAGFQTIEVAKTITVASSGWNQAEVAGPYLNLTPAGVTVLSDKTSAGDPTGRGQVQQQCRDQR